jgi:hypothetical protein
LTSLAAGYPLNKYKAPSGNRCSVINRFAGAGEREREGERERYIYIYVYMANPSLKNRTFPGNNYVFAYNLFI